MLSDKYKVKAISRKVILAWKRASETSNVTWEEIFPVICALYELDDNFHKDESFQNLKIESMPFYAHFKDILKDLNLANFNIHYFRKLTKYLLKTYLEANKELRLIQQQKIATGKYPNDNNNIFFIGNFMIIMYILGFSNKEKIYSKNSKIINTIPV